MGDIGVFQQVGEVCLVIPLHPKDVSECLHNCMDPLFKLPAQSTDTPSNSSYAILGYCASQRE